MSLPKRFRGHTRAWLLAPGRAAGPCTRHRVLACADQPVPLRELTPLDHSSLPALAPVWSICFTTEWHLRAGVKRPKCSALTSSQARRKEVSWVATRRVGMRGSMHEHPGAEWGSISQGAWQRMPLQASRGPYTGCARLGVFYFSGEGERGRNVKPLCTRASRSTKPSDSVGEERQRGGRGA